MADRCEPWLQISDPRTLQRVVRDRAEPRSAENQVDRMAFRHFRLVMAEDCGLMMLQFPEASRRMVRRPVKNPAESSLLRKDVVPVVVPKLPFFGAFRKVIGDAAYPLSLGSVGGILLILLLLSIWTVVFASHCASSP